MTGDAGRHAPESGSIVRQFEAPACRGFVSTTFAFEQDRAKLRQVRRRQGRYPLRTNPGEPDPAQL
jgi:hypothetical protein